MNESAPFVPRPREARRHAPSFERVAAVPAEAFSADCPEYDSACMVIIRLAAFLEREEYAPYMDALTSSEKRALRTTRNIAAHSGYQNMDDQLLWTAVTRNVPDMIERLRAAASRG